MLVKLTQDASSNADVNTRYFRILRTSSFQVSILNQIPPNSSEVLSTDFSYTTNCSKYIQALTSSKRRYQTKFIWKTCEWLKYVWIVFGLSLDILGFPLRCLGCGYMWIIRFWLGSEICSCHWIVTAFEKHPHVRNILRYRRADTRHFYDDCIMLSASVAVLVLYVLSFIVSWIQHCKHRPS